MESLEGNKVKISVTIDEAELEPAIDQAWKAISQEVKIPGFRAGKVPRKVLETRIEAGYARSEALQTAVPEFYVVALTEHEVDAIAQPEIDITAGEEDGDVAFDAVVEVRPQIAVSGYADITVTIPSPHPSDDDIADQIDRLRTQYGEIVAVERPAALGDYVSIDIAGSRDGEEVDGLTADDYLYEVGSGTVVAELDEQLRGIKAGEIIEFDADHPLPDEEPVHFRVLVKEVKERVLPDLDDEWAAEVTEFATVDELRDDIIERLTKVRKASASMAVQSKLGDALAALVTDEIPESLTGAEMRSRLEDLVHRLSHQGITLEQYLSMTGTEPQTFTDDLRTTATDAVKVDLALRSIAVAEDLTASDEELDEELEKLAVQMETDVAVIRRQIESNGSIPAIRSDLSNRNAIRWLTERISIVDEGGSTVSRDDLDLEDDDDDDEIHDHDHDHD